ncbi:MAG: hypothetical protein ACR5K6_03090 [Wolbachia sp.]
MEDGKFNLTKRGTIQGGTISPLLACVALHRLEQHIKEKLQEELFQYAKKEIRQYIAQKRTKNNKHNYIC